MSSGGAAAVLGSAVAYAIGAITVRVLARPAPTVEISDDGPGIPPEKRDIVFRPFFRLEEGRNQDRTG